MKEADFLYRKCFEASNPVEQKLTDIDWNKSAQQLTYRYIQQKKSKLSETLQDTNDEYWVSGRTEEEAKKNAAEKFKVTEDKISLRQGMNACACERMNERTTFIGGK